MQKIGSQEIPATTGKFDLGVQNEAGQRLKKRVKHTHTHTHTHTR